MAAPSLGWRSAGDQHGKNGLLPMWVTSRHCDRRTDLGECLSLQGLPAADRGLPITTSRVESTQKQINSRVKGTEKFWNDESLEPVLQLVSDDLSDNFDPEAFWNRRQQRFNGYREPTPRRKTETVKS